MRKQLLFLFMLAFQQGYGQNHFDLELSSLSMAAKPWNQTIAHYNLSRFWLTEKLPELHQSWAGGISYNGVLLKGIYISPALQYAAFKSSASNPDYAHFIRMRWISGSISFDVFPLELKLDTVRYHWRPFIRVGGGGSLIMPRVFQNDSLVYVNDEVYQPMVWPLFYQLGLGLRYEINRSLGLVLSAQYRNYPNIMLRDFDRAVNGNAMPDLQNDAPIAQWNFQLGLSFRFTAASNAIAEDAEREKKKSGKRRR